MNMQIKSSNLVACTCWHCTTMLMCSSVTLQLHKSITEVKLNSNVVYIKQMLPLFFVYLLFYRICYWNLSSPYMQLVDIYVSYTEVYLELFKGSVFKEMVYMNCTLKEAFFFLFIAERQRILILMHKRPSFIKEMHTWAWQLATENFCGKDTAEYTLIQTFW